VFYQFNQPPVLFNEKEISQKSISVLNDAQYIQYKTDYNKAGEEKKAAALNLANAYELNDETKIETARKTFLNATAVSDSIRVNAKNFIKQNSNAEQNDGNYIFLTFVINHLPNGLVGLLIAIIFLASMGSLASGLNSLASSSIIDFYKRGHIKNYSDKHYLTSSRIATLGWGLFCIGAALFAGKLGNLVEAVNVLGSLFYGTILGIFIVAFYLKRIKGSSVFYPALITECFVITCWHYEVMAFLWLNVLGCMLVVGLSLLNNTFLKSQK
jgi:solute:Na+ symporter, SSS family